MYRLISAVLVSTLIVLNSFGEEIFTSSASPNSSYMTEGLMKYSDGNLTKGRLLDDWTLTTGASMLSSPKLADLNGDGVAEIIAVTFDVVNPYSQGIMHVFNGAGNEMPGFPIFLPGACPSSPAIGDIDNDGDVEIVQGSWTNLYVLNATGSYYPGFPIPMYITQPAALKDLDGDDDLEIIVPVSNAMRVYHHTGTMYQGFPVSTTHDLTAASVGDLDGDGDFEITAGTYVASGSPTDYVYAWNSDGTIVPGFPVTTVGSVKAPPALADLDGNGTLEIIADCWNQNGTDQLYVWDLNGAPLPGFPVNAAYIRLSSPSVADLDMDGDLEIIVGGWTTNPYGEVVNAFHHNGQFVAGFPVTLLNNPSGNVNSTPTVGDIDGDGLPEIVVKVTNNIYALNNNGSVAAGFPIFLDDENHSGTSSPTPAIGDPDGDGLMEIFAASNFNNMMLIDQNGAYSLGAVSWGTYRNDQYNTGTYMNAPSYNVTVNLTPFTIPTIIPPGGGSFEYNIEVENLETIPVNADIWTTATLPNGSEYGPIINVNLTLNGGFSGDRDRNQEVPGSAPAGAYLYNAYVGNYPNVIYDSNSFPFSKSGDSSDGIVVYSWGNYGESFANITDISNIPEDMTIVSASPNPFNPSTIISFEIREASFVSLAVYDISGREVVTLVEGFKLAGIHQVVFRGNDLSSGIYFARLTTSDSYTVGKLLLIK